MGGSSGGGARELDQTPTWAVATVCAALIAISIFIEKVIHYFGHVFTRRRQWALYEALEKIKAELMLLGFISLILAIGQGYIEEKCIPLSLANTMLPCHHYQHKEPPNGEHHPPDASNEEHHPPDAPNEEHDPPDAPKEEHHRRLLWNEHRMLSGGGGPSKCKEGTVPLISLNGLHQLHIFIFWLAAFHVVFGAMTMMLGRLQIRGWKDWERETLSHDYDFSSDTSRFRLTKETSFVKSHSNFWTRNPIFFYIDCFFRQFFRSVRKSDYLAMRHGFISVHLAPGSKFNFQKYIKKSLEDDFKVVVGISPLLWASVIVFLLVNVSEWEALTWLAVIPLFVILAVGTKLQAIITQMALEIQERHAVIQGMPVVQVSDSHFWFGWPDLVLYLIHFTLFQNAFQITYFFWIWYEFGLNSCFFENANLLFLRVALGFGVQFMCSYVTLPLYALVTQMGSTMKRSIFDDQTSKALKKWHMNAMKKKDVQSPTTRTLGGSPGSSPPTLGKPLEQIKTTGQSARSSTSDVEQEASELPTYNRDGGGGMARQRNHNGEQEMVNGEKFSNIDLLSGP